MTQCEGEIIPRVQHWNVLQYYRYLFVVSLKILCISIFRKETGHMMSLSFMGTWNISKFIELSRAVCVIMKISSIEIDVVIV